MKKQIAFFSAFMMFIFMASGDCAMAAQTTTRATTARATATRSAPARKNTSSVTKRGATRGVTQRGRSTLYPKVRKSGAIPLAGANGSQTGLSTVKLYIPDRIADTYPNLRHYINISGGDGYILLLKANGVLPDLSQLLTNMSNAGISVSSISKKEQSYTFEESETEAEGVMAEGDIVLNPVYYEDGEPDSSAPAATEIYMDAEVEDISGCPDGENDAFVIASMTNINNELDRVKSADVDWHWTYHRVFKSSDTGDSSYCKLVVKDKTGTCWTNDTKKGMNDSQMYLYPNRVVDCDIKTFTTEEKNMSMSNWAATYVKLSFSGSPHSPIGSYFSSNTYLHVEKGKKLPAINGLVASIKAPSGKKFAGVYGYSNGESTGVRYYDDEGNPLTTINQGDPVAQTQREMYLKPQYEDVPAPVYNPDSETGCPNATETINAWNEYRATDDDNITQYRYVRGATHKDDNTDCGIIFTDPNGYCRLAKWNTKINGYSTYVSARDTKPTTWNSQDVVVNCQKNNSDISAKVYINTNSKHKNLPSYIGVKYGETLPSLNPAVTTESYSPALLRGGANKKWSGPSNSQAFPSTAKKLWNEQGEPINTISEGDLTSNTVYVCWDNCNQSGNTCLITENDCPVPNILGKPAGKKIYDGYKSFSGDTFIQMARDTNQHAIKIPEECAVVVQDTDGLYWELKANGTRMMVPESLNTYQKQYGVVNNLNFIPYVNGGITVKVDDGTGNRITTNAQNNAYSFVIGAPWGADGYAKDEAGNSGMVHLPDLSMLVSKLKSTPNGKKFAGIYSLPGGATATKTENRTGIRQLSGNMWGEFTDANLVTYRAQKYYDECGRPVAKYLSREFMEEESPYTSMYMAWSDETPNCVNECGEGKVKVTFNCGIGVGTPTFTTCISKNENIIMPENEWCSYGGERDAFEGWQQYAYPRYTHKQKPYNSSEGVQYAWYSTLLNPGASFTYNNNEYTSELAFTAVYKCTDIYHAVYDHDRCSGGFTEDYGTCVAKDCACENGFIAFEYGSRADLDPYHVEHVCIRDDR